jgi:hypothetical protein
MLYFGRHFCFVGGEDPSILPTILRLPRDRPPLPYVNEFEMLLFPPTDIQMGKDT